MTSTRASRARITETDALYLAFLAKFPAADDEALSYLTVRQSNPFGLPEGELTQPRNIEKRFSKLVELGAAVRYRNKISGVRHYGTTPLGHQAAEYYGHNIPVWRSKGIDGLTISRLEHYRNIALVAAQFASPIGYFRDTLGIEPVTIEQLISEQEMAAALEQVQAFLRVKRDKGEAGPSDFGAYRDELTKRLASHIQKGDLDPAQTLIQYPALLTVGAPAADKARFKPIHQHDLTVRLDDTLRTAQSPTAKNLLVEVELSQKSIEDYQRILLTLKRDLARKMAYQRVIYFVGTKAIENALTFADNNSGANLLKSGHLVIRPIEGRTPHRARLTKRVTVPAGEPATVQTTPAPEPSAPATTAARTRATVTAPPTNQTTPTPNTSNNTDDALPTLDDLVAAITRK